MNQMDWKHTIELVPFETLFSAAMLFAAAVSAQAAESTSKNAASDDRIIAIDVLLIPDETMWKKALAANTELRGNNPKCYALGTEQIPHISLVHRYVREQDLPQVEENVAEAARQAQPLQWELTATGYTSGMWNGLAITTIGVERTKKLDDFQLAIVKAVESNAVPSGTTAAFHTNSELPTIENDIVSYVADFVPKYSGKNYHPHVTVGAAKNDFVEQMKAKSFDEFTFKPVNVAIYQLGSYGTAQKKLWEWKPQASSQSRK